MENPVIEYGNKHPQHSESLLLLREILLAGGLQETLKWGAPMFTHNGKNVVGLGAFKSYVALWFLQGALLNDDLGVLINAQEGKTKMNRQWRFISAEAVSQNRKAILAYVLEARKLSEKKLPKTQVSTHINCPPELEKALKKDENLRFNFERFTPYKQKEFMEYIAEAKRQATREQRLEKCINLIERGVGLNDRYRPSNS